MGQRYTISGSFTLANAGGDADLLEIIPATNYPLKLISLKIGQSSEVAEAAEEVLRLQIARLTATVTSGSGGASPNIEKVKQNAGTPQFSAEMNNTTLATTSGAVDVLEEIGWNIRATPLEFPFYDEASQYDVINGQVLVVRCQTTPADDITLQITAVVEEG